MEKKELIGRKVKGFAFDSNEQIAYSLEMKKFNGVEGTISKYDSSDDTYRVMFTDNTGYYYPASLIEQHLVPESKIDMELLDKFALAALPSVIDRSAWNTNMPVECAQISYDIAKAMLDERGKYEND